MLVELGWNTLASAGVALAAWTVLRVWPNTSPRWRLALWTLVFVRLVIPVSAAHPFSLRAGVDRLLATASTTVVVDATTIANGDEADRLASQAGPASARGRRGVPLASIVWLAWVVGAVVTYARYRRRLAAFRREARDAPVADTPAIRALVGAWRRRLRIRRPVRAVAIAGSSPYTLGVLRPIIAIPRRFLRTGREDPLEPIIAHELAHVGRWDAAALGLQHLLRAVYFFNPAVWVADRHLHLARECACDAAVLAERTLTPFDYARGLLAVLRDQAGGPCGEVTGMSLSTRQWAARVAHLGTNRRASRHDAALVRAVSLLVVALVFPMGAASPDVTAASSPAPRPSVAPPLPAPTVDPVARQEPPADAIAWTNPLPGGRLTSGYGRRRSPATGAVELHTGVDLAAPAGTTVVAAADGTVGVLRNPETGEPKGGILKISHADGYATYYSLDAVQVAEGRTVKHGEPIGVVGTPAGGSGPHLHFVVMKDGRAVDPEPFITFQPAR